ncbi:MAG: SUMF1/EgtB/PvdO family nonheme iron enzyme [Gammaproteobacteria bacterium]
MGYPYFMARFPVTVAQWREYVQQSGNAVDDYNSLHGRDNDPVVSVSWHDAGHFCAFLTQAWRKLLPEGYVVTLPLGSGMGESGARRRSHPGRLRVGDGTSTHGEAGGAIEPPANTQPVPGPRVSLGESFDADKANAESTIG